MTRSLGWFLVFFILMVASGVSLILTTPCIIDPESTLGVWIPSVMGAVFAASAFIAWKVRPDWKQTSSRES